MKNYEEKYNPYLKSYNDSIVKLNNLKIETENFKTDLNWHKLRNTEDLFYNIDFLAKKNKIKREEIKKITEKSLKKKQELINLEKRIKSRFNPGYYFSDVQKKLREERDLLNDSIINLNKNIDLRLESINKNNNRKNKFQSEIKRYNSIDIFTIKEKINNNTINSKALNDNLNTLFKKKNKVEIQLKPIITELNRVDLEIEKTNSIIVKAEYYNNKLDNANSPRERAITHQECESHLGESKPNKIIRQNKELLKKHQRDLNKLLKRAEIISEKAIRVIDTIVIDGNNMAYENSKFIGLNALLASTFELKKDYKVIVIFDSEIRSMLKKSGQTISNEFDKSIKIHIVASKQKADETILDLVSGKKNNYVISNDRFSDYFDKEAVKNKRILRHEIINNSIFIHDLDLKTTF